jgi:hypothetical protein
VTVDGISFVSLSPPSRSAADAERQLECTNVTEQAALPESLIAMGESPDITNALVKERDYGLLDALKSTAALEDFVSLVITDLPAEKPEIECVARSLLTYTHSRLPLQQTRSPR